MGEYSEVFVAFDVAKKKHAVAIAEGGRTVEVRFMGDVKSHPAPIERTIKRLVNRYDRLHVCFEAGPTGYGLYRQVQARGPRPSHASSKLNLAHSSPIHLSLH
jgi:transposase